MSSLAGVDAVVPASALPQVRADKYVTVMSLLRYCVTSYRDFAPIGLYLTVPEDRLRHWQRRLATVPRPRVAMAWAGNPAQAQDHQRSAPTAAILPLLRVPGLSVLNLQPDPRRRELIALDDPSSLYDATALPHDIVDMAAAIAQCDLTVTVDTSFAHIAGAIGSPVWMMLGSHRDWRWLPADAPCLWYESLRVVRQARPGDWASAVARIRAGLERLAAGAAPALALDP